MVLVPVPVVVTPSFRVKVQVPVFGRPFNTILPVAVVQFGCVSVSTEGVFGTPPPSLFIVILIVEGDVQLELFVTV